MAHKKTQRERYRNMCIKCALALIDDAERSSSDAYVCMEGGQIHRGVYNCCCRTISVMFQLPSLAWSAAAAAVAAGRSRPGLALGEPPLTLWVPHRVSISLADGLTQNVK